MINVDDVRGRVKNCIINALELEISADDISDGAFLFMPAKHGGLELDSLAGLAVIAALCQEFDFIIEEVNPDIFESIDTLTSFVLTKINEGN